MQSNYRKLGPLIKLVNNRDRDETVTLLLGVSIQKKFIPSIANTIGTDMSTYKIIERNQFAYGPVTSRNGERISIALLEQYDEAIVSQAYTCFTVKDEAELLPQYLMMWFRRPEFDRYARFMSHGSAREIFSWDELCNTELPVPSTAKQREIVAEYHTIQNRIALNNQLIQTLETTAQAIYKQWFVEFEFPNEAGQPYRSSGGEMVDSELGEIPKGWSVSKIKDFGKTITGKTPSSESPDDFGSSVPFVTPGDFKNYKKFAIDAERNLSGAGRDKLKSKVLKPGSVIVTCIGSDMGKVAVASQSCITNQQMNSIEVGKEHYTDYLYYYLVGSYEQLRSIAMGGSTMPMLSKSEFDKISIIKPAELVMQKFALLLKPFNTFNLACAKMQAPSLSLRDLLLSKLATIETMPSAPKPAASEPAQLTLSFA